jgi:hypothetical protein
MFGGAGKVFRQYVTRSDGGRLGMSEGWFFERLKASLCKTLVPSKGWPVWEDRVEGPNIIKKRTYISLTDDLRSVSWRISSSPKMVELPCHCISNSCHIF